MVEEHGKSCRLCHPSCMVLILTLARCFFTDTLHMIKVLEDFAKELEKEQAGM